MERFEDGHVNGKPPRMWRRTYERAVVLLNAEEERRFALACGWTVADLNAQNAEVTSATLSPDAQGQP